MKNKALLFGGAAVILVAGFFFASNYYKESKKEELHFLATENAEIFVREHSPRMGDQNAKVILVEFLDPECESCRMFHPIVKEIMNEFGNRLQLVVRYAPFHRNSVTAIRALEASRVQGKYWEALDLLFKHQPEWGDHHNPQPDKIFDYLPELGLDMEKLKTDMKDPKIDALLQTDVQDLQILNVRGTPTFFVNGRPLDVFSVDRLKGLIKEEVSKNYSE